MADLEDDAIKPPGVDLTEWDDFPKQRQQIFDSVKSSFQKKFPASYGGVRMELHDVHYTDPEEYSLHEQKKALMTDKFLHRRLRGTYKLYDEKTNQLLEERPSTLMRVPYLTERGTFVMGGNEWTTAKQARLLPGVYVRRKQNGEGEAHFNSKRGTGHSFRVRLEPDTGLFKLDIGQSSLRLYSLLKDLGIPDESLEKSWGRDLLATNRDAYDKRVFEKAYQRLVRRPDPAATPEQKAQAIRDSLSATKLDRSVVERTLPNLFRAKRAAVAPGVSSAGSRLRGMVGNNNGTNGVEDQGSSHHDLNKSDLLLLAHVLDEKLGANIPMDVPTDVLVADILAALHQEAPNFNPDMLKFFIDQKKSAALEAA
jgi:DNA-directed RNA polymerase beta subunit